MRAPRAVLPRHHRPAGAAPARAVRRPAAADLHEQLPHLAPTPWPRWPATRTSPVDGLPLEFLQNKEPKLLVKDLTPVSYPKDPDLEWCPPGHGDLYTALRGTGLLDQLIDAGYTHVVRLQLRQPRRGARRRGWPAGSPTPVRRSRSRPSARTPSDRKGGHFARRKTDGRIVLRETAQTLDEDQEALADLERHRFTSTNNLWFDLRAMRDELDRARRHPRAAADPQRQDTSTPATLQRPR